MRVLKRLFFLALIGGLLVEAIGRYYGLCSYPLYVSSEAYEYIHAPHQSLRIYRNRFATNAFSMRSAPIDPQRDTTVALLIGDSVINGGNQTDQDSLASSLLEQRLRDSLGQSVRVLNVSAGSWGPDNVAAYLAQHGLFHADLMVLVVSSHDAHDQMTFAPVVGIHPQYPAEQATWAWGKLLDRAWQVASPQQTYRQAPPVKRRAQQLGISQAKGFNPGFAQLQAMAEAADIPLLLYLHATQPELAQQRWQSGGAEIQAFAQEQGLPLLDELTLPMQTRYFRDDIHLNEAGQAFLADQLLPPMRTYLRQALAPSGDRAAP
jgi:lysophospholipase L1-like esterase